MMPGLPGKPTDSQLTPTSHEFAPHFQLPKLSVLPPGVASTYRDLDHPELESEKDPWGCLAMNWGKKETQPFIDYQAMLHSHVSGNVIVPIFPCSIVSHTSVLLTNIYIK